MFILHDVKVINF